MIHFSSGIERKYWLYALAVWVAISATLFLGQPLSDIFKNQGYQAAIFMFGMVCVGIVILLHALKPNTSKTELIVIIGFVAVYSMLFLRLGLAERSHLIEYSVLTIFIHKALIERSKNIRVIMNPALLAFIFAFTVGVLDEAIQYFVPERVFDWEDIIFNGFAVGFAVLVNLIFRYVRRFKKGN